MTTPQPPTLSTREVVAESGMGVYLFRIWKDPLSCFFPCALKTDYGIFRSAEHYYQFRHLLHHGMIAESEQSRKAKDAAKAKSIVTKPAMNIHVAPRGKPLSSKLWNTFAKKNSNNVNNFELV